MSINQDFITRLTVDTVANAITSNFRIGESVHITEAGKNFLCVAGNTGDIPLSNGRSLVAGDFAVRGGEVVPVYNSSNAYSKDDKVFELTTKRYQKARDAIPSPAGNFDQTKWKTVDLFTHDDEIEALKTSSSSTSSSVIVRRTQSGHGFTSSQVGSALTITSSGYTLASASSIQTTAVGILASVEDVNTFTICLEGVLEIPSHSLVVGDFYYLETTNGSATAAYPSGLVQELFKVVDSDNIVVNINYADATYLYREEIRGGERPVVHNELLPYVRGALVYRATANRSYVCLRDIPSKVWNNNDWQEVSTINNAQMLLSLSDELVVHRDLIDGHAGYENASDFNNSIAYTYDASNPTVVHYPQTGRDYLLTATTSAGTLPTDSNFWKDISNLGLGLSGGGATPTPVYEKLTLSNDARIQDDWLTIATFSNNGVFSEEFTFNLMNTTVGAFQQETIIVQGAIHDAALTGVEWGVFGLTHNSDTNLVDYVRMVRPNNLPDSDVYLQVQATGNFLTVDGYLSHRISENTTVSTTLNDFVVYTNTGTEVEVFSPQRFNNGNGVGIPKIPSDIVNKLELLQADSRLDGLAVKGVLEKGDSFTGRLDITKDRYSMNHNTSFDEDGANFVAGFLGLDASYSTASNRVLPQLYDSTSNGLGIMGGTVASDPATDSGFAELIIPKDLLSRGMRIAIKHRSVSSSGLRRIWVYSGSVNSSNEITPVFGDGINESGGDTVTVYEVTNPSTSLHIIASKQVISGFDVQSTTYSEGIPDAPSDGVSYVRQDNTWVALPSEDAGVVTKSITPSSGDWIDLVLWTGTSLDEPTTSNFMFTGRDTTTDDFLFSATLNTIFDTSLNEGSIRVSGVTLESNLGTMLFRIVTDSGDVKLQASTQLTANTTFSMRNLSVVLSEPDVTFGVLTSAPSTGTEIVKESIDITNWSSLDISEGLTGGFRAESVGGLEDEASRLEFQKDTIQHYIGSALTLESTSEGTVISGSAASTGTGFPSPTQTANSGGVTATQQLTGTEWDNQTTGEGIPLGITNTGANYVAFFKSHAGGGTGLGCYVSNDSTESIDFQLPTWFAHDGVNQQVYVVAQCQSSSDAFNANFVMYDQAGIETSRTTVDASGDNNELFEVRLLVPAGLTRFSVGNSPGTPATQLGIRTFHIAVVLPEATLDDHLVAKFYSHTRAVSMPTVIDNGVRGFETGDLRKDPLSGLLQERVGSGWNYLANARFDTYTAPDFISYFADDGDGEPTTQGWDIPFPNRVSVVNGQYGYPALLRLLDDDGSERAEITHTVTPATIGRMRDNGFQWDFVVRTDNGRSIHYIEVTDEYNTTEGRWIYALDGTSADLRVEDVGGTDSADLGAKDKFVRMSVRREARSSDPADPLPPVQLFADDVYLFNLSFQTRTVSSGLIYHTSGSGASVDEDFYMLSSSFFTLEPSARTLTRDEINENIRLHLNSANEVIVPKGTYTNGSTFTTISGSNPVTIHGTDSEGQTFGGVLEFVIPPYHEVNWTQMDAIRGNTWAADVITRATVHSKGNELKVMVDDNGGSPIVTSRHGNYLGDITVNRIDTGEYQVIPTDSMGHVFAFSNSYIAATALDAGNSITATCWFATGYPTVNLYDDTGAAIDNNFSIDLIW